MKRLRKRTVLRYFIGIEILLLLGCGKNYPDIVVKPSQEDRQADGSVYNPSTQSFLREKHWLESVEKLDLKLDRNWKGTVTLKSSDEKHTFSLHNIPLDTLVPRFHYQPHSSPDEFDRYNLMMAEFARNGISVPKGEKGDDLAHFQSNLEEKAPWSLGGDYVLCNQK